MRRILIGLAILFVLVFANSVCSAAERRDGRHEQPRSHSSYNFSFGYQTVIPYRPYPVYPYSPPVYVYPQYGYPVYPPVYQTYPYVPVYPYTPYGASVYIRVR